MSEVVDSDKMSNCSSDSCEEYFMTSVFKSRTKKKKKNGHLTTEIVGEIVNHDHKVTPIRCLLDTGTTSTIILKCLTLNTNQQSGEEWEAHLRRAEKRKLS